MRRFQPVNVFAFHCLKPIWSMHEKAFRRTFGQDRRRLRILVVGFHCKCISLMVMHLYAPARTKGLSQIGVDASPHLRQHG